MPTKRQVIEAMRNIDALLAKHDGYQSYQEARADLGLVYDYVIDGETEE